MEHTKTKGCLDSLTLKLLAMALMLCDHLWATVLPGWMWLTHIGRIAFPIFAFQVAEGFQRTHDRKKYLLRMLAFALISEIPFNYLYYSSPVFPFHQNVMFTFFIALLLMLGLEKVRSKGAGLYILAAVLSLPVGYFLGTIGMVDYYGSGVVTVHRHPADADLLPLPSDSLRLDRRGGGTGLPELQAAGGHDHPPDAGELDLGIPGAGLGAAGPDPHLAV